MNHMSKCVCMSVCVSSSVCVCLCVCIGVSVCKALEKAKEAGRLEKNVRQSRERALSGSPGSPAEQPNFDLTYSVSWPDLVKLWAYSATACSVIRWLESHQRIQT